ncbi:MAG: OmpH family outer membrane protein [Bacteroidetes bacterium]|nr:OmpH family outer membrane protein [Bacteroidota bacterium]MBK8345780.1 OmpH family outer membrane protein [Bacteroidota bacterium]
MKHLKLLLFTILVTTAVFAQAQGKIAYINSQELLVLLPEYKDANTQLSGYAKEFETQYQVYAAEYQKLVNEIQGDPTLSEVAREAKIQDALMLEQRIQQYEQEINDKIEAKKAELFKPIITSVTETIKTVAKENGYTYVIDNSLAILILAPEGDDILPLVKKKLNIL